LVYLKGARLSGKRKRTRIEASFDALTKAMTTQFEQAKLQLQMQATQHEHELRLFNIFANAFSTGQQSSHAAPQHNSTPFYRVPDFQPPPATHFPFPQTHFVPFHLQRLTATPRQLNDSDEQSSLGESSTHYNL